MFAVISHTPTDDLNCPGISMGPVADTPQLAISGWRENSLALYEAAGAKDPEWSEEEPDRYEDTIIALSNDLMAAVEAGATIAYANGGDEQAYLVEVPEMPLTVFPRLPAAA